MKGKYAARAANREAQLDNEIIAEKLVEIAALQDQIARLEGTLAEERRNRGALIIERSNTLSEQAIAVARQDAVQQVEASRSACQRGARWICEFIRDHLDIDVPFELEHVLHDLVGNEIGEYLCIVFDAVEPGTRRYRRRRARSMGHAREHIGVNELDRHLTVLEDTAEALGADEVKQRLNNEVFRRGTQKEG